MTNQNLTDITVILDRSGSMATIREDIVNGLNTFINEQRKITGDVTFTLVNFDDGYEVIHNAVPISTVGKCDLIPRGSTALRDAIGRTLTSMGTRFSAMKEEDRPGLVIVAIVTDGQENSSKEYTNPQIKKMIETQESVYNWKFTYIGANQDSFKVSAGLGISSALDYSQGMSAFNALTGTVSRARSNYTRGMSVDNLSYTQEEIKNAKES